MTIFNSDFERDNVTGNNHKGPYYNTPVKVLTASSIIGDSVLIGNENKVGNICDIIINIHTGEIIFLIISVDVILKATDRFFAIPFQNFQINPAKKAFVLNVTIDVLERAPGLTSLVGLKEMDQYLISSLNYWVESALSITGTVGPPID